ncbi:MAG TPA: DinB family protein, partial [Pyrinomonadaceae bacterium]|nr:DinB family protein [Pyrinomonadaceae bacterium]
RTVAEDRYQLEGWDWHCCDVAYHAIRRKCRIVCTGGIIEMIPQEQRAITEMDRIRDQFRRAFEGEAWHGPSVLALLEGVTATQAAAHPIPGAHSIWELTLHIAAWESACRRRLQGDPARLSDEEDWRPIYDTSDNAWENTKKYLVDTHRDLLDAIAQVDEARLNEPIIVDSSTPFSTIYVTLHGGVQHDLYHAGQIAMLKKALENL